MSNNPYVNPRLFDLYREYTAGRVSRRGFIRGASAVLAAGVSIPGWMLGDPAQAAAAQTGVAAGPALAPLDLAEWSYFFVGVERIELARGSFVNGKQMYVVSFIPAQVRHPYPIALAHGGGGQGLDWMGTPTDAAAGRRYSSRKATRSTWSIVRATADRRFIRTWTVRSPRRTCRSSRCRGSSRRPTRRGPRSTTCASCTTSGRGPASSARATSTSSSPRKAARTSRSPGSVRRRQVRAVAAAPDVVRLPAQLDAARCLHRPHRASGARRDRHARRRTRQPAHGLASARRDAARQDRSVDHHDPFSRGPFGWLVAEIRPNLVKGIVAIEGGGQPFGGANVWGMSTIPVAYDPPVSDP